MRKGTICILAILIAICFLSSVEEAIAQTDVIVSGYVYDDSTNLPVQGVKVEVKEAEDISPALTSQSGKYTIVISGRTEARITFSKEGYNSVTSLLKLTESNLKHDVRLNRIPQKPIPSPALIIISPKSGEEVGATVRVEGRGTNVPEKFLWVYSHREGLEDWWPQGGAIKLKKNGEWKQGVFLGGPQDIGFDFEIKAIWVDEKTNRRLKDYFAEGNRTGNFPGIPLPDGSPSAEVTVHKVRQ